MADRIMKQGDTWMPMVMNVYRENTGPVNLASATGVTLRMRSSDKQVYISGPISVENASTGAISYAWDDEDTLVAGTYQLEVEVDWGLGRIETFPNDSYKEVILIEQLDEP